MANQPGNLQTNIVQLRPLAGSTPANKRGSADAALKSQGVNDPVVADGLRLARSFLLIEDSATRASIIQYVEKIAEKNPIFKR